MKELNVNQLENLEAGKFWGETCGKTYEIAGRCYQNCKYQVFWVVVSSGPEEIAC